MNDTVPQVTTPSHKPKCDPLPTAPACPEIPKPAPCPVQCVCPASPTGTPQTCFDTLIRTQNIIAAKADRAKALADQLTALQDKVKSALVDYTPARFQDLRKSWKEQDDAVVELIRKLVCAVGCWECLLECGISSQLVEIRRLEDKLNGVPGDDPMGTGELTKNVYSLYDQQAWHQRNVAQMTARKDRIAAVLAAWEKPSDTLGAALDTNDNLIKEAQNLIASDPPKAVYDVFMSLIPRHWAIRPRDPGPHNEWQSGVDPKYVKFCDCPKPKPAAGAYAQGGTGTDKANCLCDDGIPDLCCGPDVGILSLRQRLIKGPLPYILDPVLYSDMICCITNNRLSPASDQLAAAEADLAAATADIANTQKQIEDMTAAIEATFKAGIPAPFDCSKYKKKPAPTPCPSADAAQQSATTQAEPTSADLTSGD